MDEPVYISNEEALEALRGAAWTERVRRMCGTAPRIGKPVGAVVKVATLVDCHRAQDFPCACRSDWADRWYKPGLPAYHLVLANIFHLPEPVYVRGQQSVPWTLPPEVAEKVTAHLTEEVG